MKLLGSLMEENFRTELIRSHKYHFESGSSSKLKQVLEQNGHPTDKAYILHWIPDQGEDFFTILINGDYIVSTEIDRIAPSEPPNVERYELKDYLRGLSRMDQVRLLVAQDLSDKKT